MIFKDLEGVKNNLFSGARKLKNLARKICIYIFIIYIFAPAREGALDVYTVSVR